MRNRSQALTKSGAPWWKTQPGGYGGTVRAARGAEPGEEPAALGQSPRRKGDAPPVPGCREVAESGPANCSPAADAAQPPEVNGDCLAETESEHFRDGEDRHLRLRSEEAQGRGAGATSHGTN